MQYRMKEDCVHAVVMKPFTSAVLRHSLVSSQVQPILPDYTWLVLSEVQQIF